MVHSTAHGGVLYSSFVENAALTTLVLMTELSLDDICDNFHSEYEDATARLRRDSEYRRSAHEGFRNHCAKDYCRCRRKNATDHEMFRFGFCLRPDRECYQLGP